MLNLDLFHIRRLEADQDLLVSRLRDQEEKVERLEDEVERLEDEMSVLAVRAAQLEDPPFAFVCGYQSTFVQENTNIFYSKLLYNRQEKLMTYHSDFSHEYEGLEVTTQTPTLAAMGTFTSRLASSTATARAHGKSPGV